MGDRLKTVFLGLELSSPLVIGSGPLSYDGRGVIRAFRAGAGAVTTKTIRDDPADNPLPHMAVAGRDSLVNAEKWSDIPGESWVESEIPRAKDAGAVVIASVGHTPAEAERWVPLVDRAGADAIELVSYDEATLVPMLRLAKAATGKPVLAKLSPGWPSVVGSAKAALAAGADGITAIDSMGPALRIDIETGRPLLGGAGGSGWLSGAAIKALALRLVADIAAASGAPVLGTGGVSSAEDAVEMLMAGAGAVGLCTAPILRGVGCLGELNERLEGLMERLGYGSIAEISGRALPFLRAEESRRRYAFAYESSRCTLCGLCVRVCPYEARSLSGREMVLDGSVCRLCGLCASACPTGALRIGPLEGQEQG